MGKKKLNQKEVDREKLKKLLALSEGRISALLLEGDGDWILKAIVNYIVRLGFENNAFGDIKISTIFSWARSLEISPFVEYPKWWKKTTKNNPSFN